VYDILLKSTIYKLNYVCLKQAAAKFVTRCTYNEASQCHGKCARKM